MSLRPLTSPWFHGPAGHEKIWLGCALLWCFVMSLMMPYWHFRGKQNSTGEAYTVAPVAYLARAEAFVKSNRVGTWKNQASNNPLLTELPLVEPAPGGDAYLVARMWQWYPALRLHVGETYRLHLSSLDLQHGFSLQPLNMNFQVIPGYDHVITITPTSRGEFTIVCNEFCGMGHHLMSGKIFVE
ncbi:MAG: cytochrome c oxidase subunit 2 [Verrucomicrobiota bacterium]|jgi:cytochrome c oxidase subunit 2